MPGRAPIRAADADRERVAERLRKACTEGRILTEELEQRLEATFSARTYSQLDAVVADLPGRRVTPRERAPRVGWGRPVVALATTVAVAVALIAVVFVLTGVLAIWMLWLLAGWWFFGRHRRRVYRARYARHDRPLQPYCGWHDSRGRAGGFGA